MKEDVLNTKRTFSGKFIFCLGLLMVFTGVLIMRQKDLLYYNLFNFSKFLQPIIITYKEVFVGGLIALSGAILLTFSIRKFSSDTTQWKLPPTFFKYDLLALVLLIPAVISFVILYWHIVSNRYTHWDIAFFLVGLILVGFVVHRLTLKPKNKFSFHLTRSDFILIAILVLFSIAINSIKLTSWNYANIGDEFNFFNGALNILHGGQWNFFNIRYVYDMFPALDSAYTALILKLFGANVVGWRLSVIFVTAASVALIYILSNLLYGRTAAVGSGVVLASSHFLFAFNHIAYDTTHAFIPSIIVILMLVLLIRTQNSALAYSTGLALGFCSYTNHIALVTWPAAAILLLMLFLRNATWRTLYTGLFILAGFILVITPLVIVNQASYYSYSIIFHTQSQDPAAGTLQGRSTALVQTFLIFFANPQWHHHYIGSPLVDVVTGALLLIGFVFAFSRITRVPELIPVIWLIISLLVIGLSNYVVEPSITRIIYTPPAVALIAGLGLTCIYAGLRSILKFNSHTALVMVIVLLLIIPPLNLYHSLVINPRSTRPEIWYEMRLKALQDHPKEGIVEVVEEDHWGEFFRPIPYPELAYYKYINLSALRESSNKSSNESTPIYFVRPTKDSIASEVAEILPSNYHMVRDYDQMGEPGSWLFIPDKKQN
jgi:4-amino-4-deoxy-L-arabinose transferase-like glycosyltransferase